MAKRRRNPLDKLNTLLYGKDLRVTEGEPYTEVREFDFSSDKTWVSFGQNFGFTNSGRDEPVGKGLATSVSVCQSMKDCLFLR